MKKERPPDATPPPDVQAWLDGLSDQDRQELLRTWQWAALAQASDPDTASTTTAWSRLQASLEAPPSARLAEDRPAHIHRRSIAKKSVLWLFLVLAGVTAAFYFWDGFSNRLQASLRPAQQAHFMLLLRDEGRTPSTPEAHAARVAEFAAWASDLDAAGHFLGGDELAEEGHLLQGTSDPTVQSLSASSGMIGGYFIIAAATYAEAMILARTCPQLRHGGTVELRPIVQH